MKTVVMFAAASSLCISAQAQAQTQTCLNARDVEGLAGYFLPTVAKQMQTECSASLPANSYLRTGFAPWVAQLDAAHESYWPAAKAGFLKFAGNGAGKADKDIMAAMATSDDALKAVIGVALESKMKLSLKPNDCAEANDIAEALSPLNPAQSVTLIARIFSAALRKDRGMPTCPRT